ncbi:MAG: hypothetical protein KAS72_12550 [Phycisphaerales bacterium]|nr:hypothetical protein [Phycisphaerales bacterium]
MAGKKSKPPLLPPPVKREELDARSPDPAHLDGAILSAVGRVIAAIQLEREHVNQPDADSLLWHALQIRRDITSADQLNSLTEDELKDLVRRIRMRERMLQLGRFLLVALQNTHASIKMLCGFQSDSENDDDGIAASAVDAGPLVRVQLERVFHAILFVDNPDEYCDRYLKRFYRNHLLVEHRIRHAAQPILGGSGASNGADVIEEVLSAVEKVNSKLREDLGISEDEEKKILGQIDQPELDMPSICKFPTCGNIASNGNWTHKDGNKRPLLSAGHRVRLAAILYPFYDSYSDSSHSDLRSLLEAFRQKHVEATGEDPDGHTRQYQEDLIDDALATSYVSMLCVATLFVYSFDAADPVRSDLQKAWSWVANHTLLGACVWDNWMRLD